VNFFRGFFSVLMLAVIIVALVLFFQTERQSKILNEVKPKAEAAFSDWETKEKCVENPKPCAAYSEQFSQWLTQFDQYKERREQSLKFQYYTFLKDLDDQYLEDSYGGLASLIAASVILSLFTFLITHSGKPKRNKISRIEIKTEKFKKLTASEPKVSEPKVSVSKPKAAEPSPKTAAEPPPKAVAEPPPKAAAEPPPKASKLSEPDSQALLRKATDCADSTPAQAISYLEQAIAGSLSTRLSLAASLLCGSLRLQNDIGTEQGKSQLNQIISSSSQSAEAKKAKIVLDTFK
jgi:hypothetical protein